MDIALYIKNIKKECTFLEKKVYIFSQLENNIYYVKKNNSEGLRIRFNWIEYGGKFVSQGLIAEKRFNIVEQEIQKVLGGKLEAYYTIYKTPSTNYIPKGIKFTEIEKNIRFSTNTIIDIKLFCEFIKRFYQRDIIPFFDTHKEFADTAKLYEKLKREKVSSLIVNNGTDIFYRELVIKNKAKAIDESDFIEMVVTELESLKTNPTFGKLLKNFKRLQSSLQTNM